MGVMVSLTLPVRKEILPRFVAWAHGDAFSMALRFEWSLCFLLCLFNLVKGHNTFVGLTNGRPREVSRRVRSLAPQGEASILINCRAVKVRLGTMADLHPHEHLIRTRKARVLGARPFAILTKVARRKGISWPLAWKCEAEVSSADLAALCQLVSPLWAANA